MANHATYIVELNIREAWGVILDGMDCGQQGCVFAHVQRRRGNRPTGMCRCIANLKGDQIPMVETILKEILQKMRGEYVEPEPPAPTPEPEPTPV